MIEINFFALFLTIVVFLVLVWYLNNRLYKPLLSFMDARDEAIARDQALIEKNLKDATSEEQEVREIHSKAREEANAIKNEAINEFKEEAAQKIKAKRDELELEFVQYEKELEEEKEILKNNLQKKLPEFRSSIKANLARI
ncbi:ATP synthase, F0 complex, b' subunit [Campylobacter blaseri]|uniref:Uncharacterized protein n=1 Tax=Campylobacter blaseri TaxID=2042961 RepID=A0A2P8QZE1_9BACT|nr:hypothetical protein [Campylobacter blaseri]PSM51603.1 hypothetical protein CQ405_07350 [Campylobacter blaseri]PSM53396.1 hypothetical protein CRN67_07355 [Campylobacter blaseri]QKF86692.1 ATP synthase, F0 complex, b' subunit [Campylobacter blaseri]